jgi:hypothetical protein
MQRASTLNFALVGFILFRATFASGDNFNKIVNSDTLPSWLPLAGLGFLEGFTQTSDLHECVKAGMVPSGDIKAAILDIQSGLQEHNVTDLQDGIELLFKFMDELPTIMQGCKMEEEDVEAIVKVLKGFHSLKDILAHVQADMKADHQGEILREFELMVRSFTEKQYEEFGKHAGKAWHLLFIGSPVYNPIQGANGGILKVSWSSCDAASAHGKVSSVQPDFLTLGAKTTIVGSGSVDEAVTAASASVTVKAGFFHKTVNFADACAARTISTPLGSLTFQGITCPLAAGPISVNTDVQLSGAIPSFLARASIKLRVTAANGDELVCMDIKTKPASKAAAVLV